MVENEEAGLKLCIGPNIYLLYLLYMVLKENRGWSFCFVYLT